jgi:hypothetical protein
LLKKLKSILSKAKRKKRSLVRFRTKEKFNRKNINTLLALFIMDSGSAECAMATV